MAQNLKLGVFSEEGSTLLSNTDEDTNFRDFKGILEASRSTVKHENDYMVYYLVKKYHRLNAEYRRYRARNKT